MSEPRRIPAGLRQTLDRALEIVTAIQEGREGDEESLAYLLEDLKLWVRDALAEVRTSSLPNKREIERPLKVADGILLHLEDAAQRDARGRLRDVARYLREARG